jgi:hypothetical protein
MEFHSDDQYPVMKCVRWRTGSGDELRPVMNFRVQDRMRSTDRQEKRGGFTLREAGQRIPTVTYGGGILRLL